MSDERRARAAADDRTETRRPARRIPPLVWIVIFLLVAWFAWAWVQRGGTDVTPHGGTMPREAQGTSTMPPNGAAPPARK
jgi:hypothetical protein